MPDREELLRCPTPWCSHQEPPYLWQGPTDDYTIICPECQVEGAYGATEEDARDAWNTRISPSLDVERVAVALEREFPECIDEGRMGFIKRLARAAIEAISGVNP